MNEKIKYPCLIDPIGDCNSTCGFYLEAKAIYGGGARGVKEDLPTYIGALRSAFASLSIEDQAKERIDRLDSLARNPLYCYSFRNRDYKPE